MMWERIPRRTARYPVPSWEFARRGQRWLLRRLPFPVVSPYAALPTSLEASALFEQCLKGATVEELWVVSLDEEERPMAAVRLAVGGASNVSCADDELCTVVAATGACSFLVAHNHPSGDPRPSIDDWIATREGIDAACRVGLEYVDHLVLAGGQYASLRALNEGMFLGLPGDVVRGVVGC